MVTHVLLGIGGKNYNLDPADPRFDHRDGVRTVGRGQPGVRRQPLPALMRTSGTANIMLQAMDNLSDTPPAGMSPAEKEATLG
jgi:hypothetical protein